VHLSTKLQNRILSETSTMVIGKEEISTEISITLIQNKSKLVRTDIDPKDRQNCNSYLKLSSNDVLVPLEDLMGLTLHEFIYKSYVLSYWHISSMTHRLSSSLFMPHMGDLAVFS
jgi:hypothetical protein